MEYTIPAKPTIYANTRFRSRLEARWAAMFDLLRWPYVYEPLDLDYWSPDFMLLGTRTIMVEVKPILTFAEDIADKMSENLMRWLTEFPSARRVEPLLLGACPFLDAGGHPHFGWCAEGDAEGFYWSEAMFGLWVNRNPSHRFGYCHASFSFDDRINGGYDGGSFGGDVYGEYFDTVKPLWAKAGNLTQWKFGDATE